MARINKIRGSVKKRGKKWYYSFDGAKINGKRNVIGGICVGAETESDAIRFLNQMVSEYDSSGVVVKEVEVSFSDYLDRWYEKEAVHNLKQLTLISYTSMITKHIKPALGHYKLKGITTTTLQDFINAKSQEYSRSTVTVMLAVLRDVYKFAVLKDKVIKINHVRDVTIPKRMKKTARQESIHSGAVTVDQMNQILGHFKKRPEIYTIFLIAYYFGLRMGEVIGLRWKNIDFDKNQITIDRQLFKANGFYQFGPPKTEASTRTLGFGDEMGVFLKNVKKQQALNRLKYGEHYTRYALDDDKLVPWSKGSDEIDLVCTHLDGRYISKDYVNGQVRMARDKFGFYFRFHMMRHTNGTMLTDFGADPFTVKSNLGHGSLKTTEIYVHSTAVGQKKSVDIKENCLQKLIL